MERALAALGNPERALPPVIHVAGTNGKGSTIAYLRAILEAAGHRVHVYTSPHLVRFNERIRLAGREIDDRAFSAVLEESETANGGAPITLFEITTVAAFLAFSRTPADILLLEVGLGGRFDATNVIDRPLATAITPVSMDHMQYLGDSIEKIAFEKAGIIKPDVPVVIGPQRDAALAVVTARAADLGAPVIRYGDDFRAWIEGGSLSFEMAGVSEVLDPPGLLGAHQVQNAAVALALASTIGATLPNGPSARSAGMTSVSWPARLQALLRGPLADRCAEAGWSLWLDGGHNADAGMVLANQLRQWRTQKPEQPIHLIVGMLNTKACADYLMPLAGLVDRVWTVAIPGEAATLSADELAETAKPVGLPATPCASVDAALAAALSESPTPGRALIAGSLYLAGTVLRENG